MNKPCTNSDGGMTLIELVIAAAILMLASAVTAGALASFQNAQEFSRRRTLTLDELREGAAAFSRDARQAENASISGTTTATCSTPSTTSCGTTLTFDTFVAGTPVHLVRWELKENVAGSGNLQLIRTDPAGVKRIFGSNLNSGTDASAPSFFEYMEVTSTAPAGTRPTIHLRLNTKPKTRDPIIGLSTKVTLRNG